MIGDTAYDGARLRDFDRFAYPVFLLRVASYEDVPLALGALGDATGRTQQGRACSAPCGFSRTSSARTDRRARVEEAESQPEAEASVGRAAPGEALAPRPPDGDRCRASE